MTLRGAAMGAILALFLWYSLWVTDVFIVPIFVTLRSGIPLYFSLIATAAGLLLGGVTGALCKTHEDAERALERAGVGSLVGALVGIGTGIVMASNPPTNLPFVAWPHSGALLALLGSLVGLQVGAMLGALFAVLRDGAGSRRTIAGSLLRGMVVGALVFLILEELKSSALSVRTLKSALAGAALGGMIQAMRALFRTRLAASPPRAQGLSSHSR